MRQKARCCSAHLRLLDHWAPDSWYSCLYACTPAPATFGQNDIQAPAFAVNAVVCSTAFAMNIIAVSRARRVQPVILAEGI